jgi:undecaprenyl-diphosphatase
MDIISPVSAIILGVVEGLTEFLPISSTGHLILTNQVLQISGEKIKLFDVFIQLGAILAVVWYFRAKILSMIGDFRTNTTTRKFVLNLLIAFTPAAAIGFLSHKAIKQYLFNPITVSIALIAGGILIWIIEHLRHSNKFTQIEGISKRSAFWVGIAQLFSMIPGVSRSGATIMGGLLAGMDRQTATTFSFFLALPTMMAATTFDLVKSRSLLNANDLFILGIGFITAFFSALLVVHWLIRFVSHHTFLVFAYYRIIFGVILLSWFLLR